MSEAVSPAGKEVGSEAPAGIATLLLRLNLDPRTGHLPRGRVLDVCLRAGLFCDLALAGAVRSERGTPICDDPAPAQKDPVLYGLARAVHDRPNVAWRRWFTHVAPDRTALIKALVEAGVWSHGTEPGASTRHVIDLDPAYVSTLTEKLRAVRTFARGPHSAREAILGYLADLSSGERPKTVQQRWTGVLPPALTAEDPGRAMDTAGPAIMAAVRTATQARRPRGIFRR